MYAIQDKILVKSGRDFTLIEMLVVIAIISILSAILMPALIKARDTALSVSCQSNLRQLGMGVKLYSDDNRGWLPVAQYRLSGDMPYNWKGAIAQYTGGKTPNPINYWRDEFAEGLFLCPKWETAVSWNRYAGGYAWNLYVGHSEDYIYRPRQNIAKLRKLSETILIADSVDSVVGTSESRYLTLQIPSTASSLPYIPASDRHSGGTNIVWLDQHVSWMSQAELILGRGVLGDRTVSFATGYNFYNEDYYYALK